MIKVAYCDVSNLDMIKAYELLPKNRKEKFDNFRFDKDKKLSAGAYLLLVRLLNEEKITKYFSYLITLSTFASDLKNVCHLMMADELKSDSSQILRELLKQNRSLRK